MRQGLCNGMVSVSLSVCPDYGPLLQRAAGLLLAVYNCLFLFFLFNITDKSPEGH